MSDATATRMDQALAEATAGDALAFAALVRAHQGMVFSLAYHFLHNRLLAEDLAWVAHTCAQDLRAFLPPGKSVRPLRARVRG